MKSVALVLLLISCYVCNAQEAAKPDGKEIKPLVKFEKKEIVITEKLWADTLKIPLVFQGEWPKDVEKMSIRFSFSGDAAVNYDYKKNWSTSDDTFTINKKDLNPGSFAIIILPDDKYEQTEVIIIKLEAFYGDGKLSATDKNFNELTVKIEEKSKLAKDLITLVNEDKDTSQAIGNIHLIAKKPAALYELVEKKIVNKKVKEEESKVLQIQTQKTGKVYSQKQVPQEITEEKVVVEQKVKNLNVEVKKVTISLYEGLINEMKVETEITDSDGKIHYEDFVNTSGRKTLNPDKKWRENGDGGHTVPIALRYLKFRPSYGNIRLYGSGRSGNTEWRSKYLRFDELLYYSPNVALNYSPGNTKPGEQIVITQSDPVKEITTSTALKNYVSLNLYSDFLSLINAVKGNGLIQTEASSKFYWRTRNVPKTNLFLVNYFMPQVKISRFDNDFASVLPDTITKDSIRINRMLLNQRAFLNASLKLNIFKFNTKLRNEIELNALTRFDWANVKSKPILPENKNEAVEYKNEQVNLFSVGLEGRFQVSQFHNFHIAACGTVWFQKLWNSPPFANKEFRIYLSPEVEISYQPIADMDNKIFLRFRTLLTTNPSEDKHFVQMQVGYKILLKFNAI